MLGGAACGDEPSAAEDDDTAELAATATGTKPIPYPGLDKNTIKTPATKSWIPRKGQTHFVIQTAKQIDFELRRKIVSSGEWAKLYPFKANQGKALLEFVDDPLANKNSRIVGYEYTFDTSLQTATTTFSAPGPTKGGGQRSNASYYGLSVGGGQLELYSECGFENQECCWGNVDRCGADLTCNNKNVCAKKQAPKPDPKPSEPKPKPDPKPDPKPVPCGGVGQDCCANSTCHTANSICVAQEGGAKACSAPGDIWTYQCECAGGGGEVVVYDVEACFVHDMSNPPFAAPCNVLSAKISALVCASKGPANKASTSSCTVAPGAYAFAPH
jgi:hypothetical protein